MALFCCGTRLSVGAVASSDMVGIDLDGSRSNGSQEVRLGCGLSTSSYLILGLFGTHRSITRENATTQMASQNNGVAVAHYPQIKRLPPLTALDAIGGELPVGVPEMARRAYSHALNPLANPVMEVMAAAPSIFETAPMLGIFNDIPQAKMREDEVMSWATAGFLFVINDGEHSQVGGRMGRAENAMQLRVGITPIQRLHREAVSEHGDALCVGARGTMRPYATSVEEAAEYCHAVSYPKAGASTKADRGGFPMRMGDRSMHFTPSSLRAAEDQTQGWLQFETSELIGAGDTKVREPR